MACCSVSHAVCPQNSQRVEYACCCWQLRGQDQMPTNYWWRRIQGAWQMCPDDSWQRCWYQALLWSTFEWRTVLNALLQSRELLWRIGLWVVYWWWWKTNRRSDDSNDININNNNNHIVIKTYPEYWNFLCKKFHMVKKLTFDGVSTNTLSELFVTDEFVTDESVFITGTHSDSFVRWSVPLDTGNWVLSTTALTAFSWGVITGNCLAFCQQNKQYILVIHNRIPTSYKRKILDLLTIKEKQYIGQVVIEKDLGKTNPSVNRKN